MPPAVNAPADYIPRPRFQLLRRFDATTPEAA